LPTPNPPCRSAVGLAFGVAGRGRLTPAGRFFLAYPEREAMPEARRRSTSAGDEHADSEREEGMMNTRPIANAPPPAPPHLPRHGSPTGSPLEMVIALAVVVALAVAVFLLM
jgi:hypothetical protein